MCKLGPPRLMQSEVIPSRPEPQLVTPLGLILDRILRIEFTCSPDHTEQLSRHQSVLFPYFRGLLTGKETDLACSMHTWPPDLGELRPDLLALRRNGPARSCAVEVYVLSCLNMHANSMSKLGPPRLMQCEVITSCPERQNVTPLD